MLHVPGCAAAAPAVLAEELIGERVVSQGDAVQQLGELLLLAGGDVAYAEAEGEAEPGGRGLDAGKPDDGLVGAGDDQLPGAMPGSVVGWPEPGRWADRHGPGESSGRGG
jgi:hypothetical protein